MHFVIGSTFIMYKVMTWMIYEYNQLISFQVSTPADVEEGLRRQMIGENHDELVMVLVVVVLMGSVM